ncbi:MAG: redoxin domain-containing protein [Bacteroidota bacterium]
MKLNFFRHLLFFTAAIALLASCGKSGNKVKGVIKNGEGKTVYLERYERNKAVAVDSATLDASGEFELAYEKNKTDFYRLRIDETNYCVLILDSSNTAEIEADASNLFNSYTVKGSPNSQVAREYYLNNYNYMVLREKLRNELMLIPVTDSSQLHAKLADVEKVKKDYADGLKAFIDKNSNSAGIIVAISELDPINDLQWMKKIEGAAALHMANSEMHQSIKAQVSQAEYSKKMYDMQKAEEERLSNLLAKGSLAPEIDLPNPDGKNIALSSLRGKYVLIDFWASWCGPCRKENPNVVALYNKYKGKGFEIYSVSLDNNKDKWVNAIAADGLVWKSHVSDLKQWQTSVISTYGFNAIPFTVLVDKDGKVIGTNLRGPALEEKLKEIFG